MEPPPSALRVVLFKNEVLAPNSSRVTGLRKWYYKMAEIPIPPLVFAVAPEAEVLEVSDPPRLIHSLELCASVWIILRSETQQAGRTAGGRGARELPLHAL